MTLPADFYTNLITPEHNDKPKFFATVDQNTSPYQAVSDTLESMPGAFDLDDAVGVQLDAVGVRIGLSRRIVTPLVDLYFSIDDPLRGLDRGILYDPRYGDEYGVVLLDDNTYRRLLYAKIASNTWDGTVPGAQAILDQFFDDPATFVIVQDDTTSAYANIYFAVDDPSAGVDQGIICEAGDPLNNVSAANVGMTIGVAGKLPALPLLCLLEQQEISVKPMGVPITFAFTSQDYAPLFGIDVDNQYIAGLDQGAIGVTAEFILNAPGGAIYPSTGA